MGTASRALGQELASEADRRQSEGDGRDGATVVQEVLTERGYEPFRDGEGGIRLRNCPFDRLADAHRDLICGMNLCLLEEAVGGAQSGLRAVLDPQPGMCCVTLLPDVRGRKRA